MFNLFIIYLFVVSCWYQKTYVARGCPRRPNPLRGKDLGQQQHKLEHQVKVKLRLGNPLDIARLSGVKDFFTLHDFRPLVTLWVFSVEDNANDAGWFYL
jgi:hypothetical protein